MGSECGSIFRERFSEKIKEYEMGIDKRLRSSGGGLRHFGFGQEPSTGASWSPDGMPVSTFVKIRLLAFFIETFAVLACLVTRVYVGEEVLLPLLFDPSTRRSPLKNALVLLCIDVERLVFG